MDKGYEQLVQKKRGERPLSIYKDAQTVQENVNSNKLIPLFTDHTIKTYKFISIFREARF